MEIEVELGEHFERFIVQMVESGRYSSANEVIIAALENLKEKEEFACVAC